jgi:hypothetical protein
LFYYLPERWARRDVDYLKCQLREVRNALWGVRKELACGHAGTALDITRKTLKTIEDMQVHGRSTTWID